MRLAMSRLAVGVHVGEHADREVEAIQGRGGMLGVVAVHAGVDNVTAFARRSAR